MTFSDRISWRMLAMVGVGAVLAIALFVAFGGAARAIVSPSIERAGTVVLTDQPGGDGVRAQLFKIGDVAVIGRCEANQDGSVLEMLMVRNGTTHGVMLAAGEFNQFVPAGDTEALTADAPDVRTAQQVPVAILDERGISASGVGAESVNPAAHRCVFTAQVAG